MFEKDQADEAPNWEEGFGRVKRALEKAIAKAEKHAVEKSPEGALQGLAELLFRISVGVHTNYCHGLSVEKGWWDEGVESRNKGELLMLIVSEVAEAMEALRTGKAESDHIPGMDPVAEEMADIVIRVMDFCGAFDIDLADAIISKGLYNQTRPHRHGGKAF